MENDDLQQTLDLLPLVCLSFNVIVLLFAFSEHFAFLFNPWRNVIAYLHSSMSVVLLGLFSGSNIPDCSSQETISIEVVTRYAMDIYRKTVTTLTRSIVIAAS